MDVNEKWLIKIKNEDEDCMFFATEVARIYAESIENKKFAFYRLLKNEKRQKELVDTLKSEVKLEPKKDGYGLNDLIKVQEFYDEKYPKRYRIILFDSNSIYLRPIYKGPRPRKYDLNLYLNNNHYDVIRKVSSFFKIKKRLCVDCGTTYTKDSFHRKSCAARCYLCGVVSNESPCENQNVEIKCLNCKRTYFNEK